MRALTVLPLIFFVSLATAASKAPVVDLSEQAAPRTPAQKAAQPPEETQGPDFYYQIQLLQEEVRQLRGMVEEQANEIQQLKQRQMDDYMDLDRRISGGQSTAPTANQGAVAASDADTEVGPESAGAVPEEERNHYTAAYNLLKSRQIDGAIPAFKEHIARYPRGKYVANAYYWLGEIYMLQNKLEDARQAFAHVVEDYPAHRKAPDATFKLGKAYYMLGDKAKARQYLERVASGNSSSARLAQAYLRENF